MNTRSAFVGTACALFALASAATSFAQLSSQTLPAGFDATAGNSEMTNPFLTTATQRHHFTYDSGEFAASGPIRIRSIAFRPGGDTTGWGSGTYLDFSLALALSASDYSFSNHPRVFDENFLSVPETWFAGDLTVPAGTHSGVGVAPYSIVLPNANGFVYDPRQQHDLILDVRTPGGAAGSNPRVHTIDGQVDTNRTLGGNTYAHFSNPCSPTWTFARFDDFAPIVKIEYEPFIGVHAQFGASPTKGFAPHAVDFHALAFTSHASGIQSLEWDFENDGIVDSNAAQPTFIYQTPGTYSVRLLARDGANNIGTLLRTALITVHGTTSNTLSPEILEYHFDEVRGNRAFNSASTTIAPRFGTLNHSAWQGAANRAGFQGNEPGFGCLAADSAFPFDNTVDSGWPLDFSGSCTISWWQRMQSAPGSFVVRVCSAGQLFRIFTGGVAGNRISLRGTPIGDFDSIGSVQTNAGVWTHVALIIDDINGEARWYLDGQLDSTRAFTPGTFRVCEPGTLRIGSDGTSAAYTRFYDIDDFRFYARPVISRIFSAPFSVENATNSIYDQGCAASGPVPQIDGNSAPTLGNAGYQISLHGAAPGSALILVVGFSTYVFGLFPLDLSGIVGPGCSLAPMPDFSFNAFTPSGSALFASPIPADPLLIGAHVYSQWIALGPIPATSPGLDINLR